MKVSKQGGRVVAPSTTDVMLVRAGHRRRDDPTPRRDDATRAFTLVEIAICLGIIGFALVAIIGILPAGLQVQRDNREDTIINQEATYLIEAIRNGAEELTNFAQRVDHIILERIVGSGPPEPPPITRFTPSEAIGLLSSPSDYDLPNVWEVRAVIKAGAGAAADTATDLAFKYQVTVRNYAFTNASFAYSQEMRMALSNELRELRLEFRWPVLANGGVGAGRQVFRTQVNGILDRWEANTPTNSQNVDCYLFRP